jgi:hypothetical protein
MYEHSNVNYNVNFNLELSSGAYSWMNEKKLDNVRMHGTTVKIKEKFLREG